MTNHADAVHMGPHLLRTTLALSLGMATPWLAACADRSVTVDTGEDDGTEGPPAPGEALSSCVDEDDCFVEWCVHPAGEPGFCTFACSSAAECPDASSGTATATCLVVGGDQVCALDCADGRSCPTSMRCEQIESGQGVARSICF